MAGEFVHADVGGELTEAEYHALLGHILNDQARGDLIISNSAATGLVRLALGVEDALLVAGASDPQWSTLRWDGADLGPSADADLLALAADVLTVRGQAYVEGYVAIGNIGGLSSNKTLRVGRTFTTGAAAVGNQFLVSGSMTAAVNQPAHIAEVQGGVTEAASGTHPVISTLRLREPNITTGGATTITAASLYVQDAPTEGTNNYALFVDSGDARFDGQLLGTGATAGAPAYAIRGDADTGVYASAADTLDFSTGGTHGLRLDSSQRVHVQSVGSADVELEVSDGSTTGGGTIHRAASATHSLLELKSNVVYLNDAQELQAQSLADVLALRHVDFQYKRQLWTDGEPATYDEQGVEITPAVRPAFTGYEEPEPAAPVFRGLIYEDAPASIRESAHSAIVIDRRVANLELAIQELTRRVAVLEAAS